MGQSMSTVSPDTVGTVPRPSGDRDLSSPTSATPTELFASSPRQAAEDSAALRKRMTANQLQAMDTESESSSNVASSLGKRRTDATVDGGGQDATFDDGGMANLSPNYTEPLQVLRCEHPPWFLPRSCCASSSLADPGIRGTRVRLRNSLTFAGSKKTPLQARRPRAMRPRQVEKAMPTRARNKRRW